MCLGVIQNAVKDEAGLSMLMRFFATLRMTCGKYGRNVTARSMMQTIQREKFFFGVILNGVKDLF